MSLLTDEVLDGLSAPIYCRSLDATTLRELIGSNGRLIAEDPAPGVPRVAMPRPPRQTMQDLYVTIGSMEIRQGVLERMFIRCVVEENGRMHKDMELKRRSKLKF
ncbi:hypothetical protein Tco_0869083 [Tanacetum coccineum]